MIAYRLSHFMLMACVLCAPASVFADGGDTQSTADYDSQMLAYQQALVTPQAKIKIEALHRAITQQDRETVAASVCYPARIMFRDKQINVENKDMLLQYYDAIFTARFMTTLEKISWVPAAIGAKGIAVGDGQIWFDMNGCVVTFNNNWYVM